jgi:hypothetical protein
LSGREKNEMIEVLKKGNRQGMKMKEIAEAMGVKQSVTSALVLTEIKDGTVLKSENTIDGAYLYSLANYDGYAENIKPAAVIKEKFVVPKRLEHIVNSPSHYTNGAIECIDAMKSMLSIEEYVGFLRGNVFKYQWRYKNKNGVEDLRKSQWYMNKLIEYSIK